MVNFLFILLFVTLVVSDDSGTCGDNCEWSLSDGVLTINGTGNMTNWDSGNPWSRMSFYITSIIINDGIESIGDQAFSFCDKPTEIAIPDSVQYIGKFAFSSCQGLTNVTIGSGVVSIGDSAFSGCLSLTTITIPASVQSIGKEVFMNCRQLGEITVDDGNPYYCNNNDDGVLFTKNMDTLIQYPVAKTSTSYIIPDSVKTIGDYAFHKCKTLTSVTLPENLEIIGDYAFNQCSGLTSLTIGNHITTIGKNSFQSCSNIKDLVIGTRVETIGDNAFSYCYGIESLTIPESVRSICKHAFYYCDKLTSVTLSGFIESVGEYAFKSCDKLSTINYESTEEPTSCGSEIFSYSQVTEVNVPANFNGSDFCGTGINKTNLTICGEFTTDYKQTTNIEPCQCVDGASFVDEYNVTCECDTGYHGVGNECHKIIKCGEFTTEYNNATNTEECECVDNAEIDTSLGPGSTTCKCDNGYHGVGNECHKIIRCGEFTTEYNNATNTEECQCVDDATFIDTNNSTCKCIVGIDETEDNKCKEIITCGEFTTEYNNATNTEPCQCVDDATFIDSNNITCKCLGGVDETEDNKCKEIITCGEFTTEYNNATNTEQCVCVDHATFVDTTNSTCECDTGYLAIENECHKIIKCGEFTTEYKNTTNTEQCVCVDHAQIDPSLGEGSTTCKCDTGFEGNTEKTVCSQKSNADDSGNKDEGSKDNKDDNSNGSYMITMLLVILLVILL